MLLRVTLTIAVLFLSNSVPTFAQKIENWISVGNDRGCMR